MHSRNIQINKIFISYSQADYLMAKRIINELHRNGINNIEDLKDINIGASISDAIKYSFAKSDAILILLSKNYHESSSSHMDDLSFLKQSQKRKMVIIPVHIDNSKIPEKYFNYSMINLVNNFDVGIKNIVDKISLLSEIDLEMLGHNTFTNFVCDLLKEYGFSNLTHYASDHVDFGFDLSAEHWSRDPFGFKAKEHWLIEIKYYGQDRFSINTIQHLIDLYNNNREPNTRILLITNSILTSVAEEYLNNIKKSKNIPISVLDGNALRRLVLKRSRLIRKYFTK
jgi:hypothetical protein